MITVLFYLLAISLSLGQLGRITFFDQQINIYLFEPIILLLLFFLPKKFSFSSPFNKSIVTLIAIFFLSLVINFWQFNILQNLVGLLYLLRLSMYILFGMVIWQNRTKYRQIITNCLYIFTLGTILFSLTQYFLYPDLRNLYYLGWDPHASRIFGLFFDSSTLGIILVLLFFWIYKLSDSGVANAPQNDVILVSPKDASRIFQKFRYVLMGLLLILLLLTYSRIAYIGFIVGLIWFFWKKIGLLKLTLAIFLFLSSLFLLPRPFGESVKLERIFTIESRLQDNIEGIHLFQKSPLIGVGYNRLKYVRDVDLASHAGSNYSSSYVTILATTGLMGMLAFLYMLSKLYVNLPFNSKGLLTIVLVATLFDNILLTNFILALLPLVLMEDSKDKQVN